MENKPNGAVHLLSTVAQFSLVVNHSGVDAQGHPYATPFTEEKFQQAADEARARYASEHPLALLGDMTIMSEEWDGFTVWRALCPVVHPA